MIYEDTCLKNSLNYDDYYNIYIYLYYICVYSQYNTHAMYVFIILYKF